MQRFTLVNEGNTGVVKVTGELTVQYCEEFKELLLKAFGASKEVRIDLQQMTEIDIPGIQMFCAAHKTSRNLNKPLNLAGGLPDILIQAADESGFFRTEGCMEKCLWIRRDI